MGDVDAEGTGNRVCFALHAHYLEELFRMQGAGLIVLAVSLH
jgi:hypothetical protein